MTYRILKQFVPVDTNQGDPDWAKRQIWVQKLNLDDTYDEIRDAFLPSKPFSSWVLNEETCLWEAPIERPSDGKVYTWNEDGQSWVEYTEE